MVFTRWIVGIVGGLLVFIAVTMLLGFFLRNVFEGVKPWDTLVGLILPVLLGLLAGIQSFRRSVWPKESRQGNRGA
jgi:F0F1-type ATP synthase assembly protein I